MQFPCLLACRKLSTFWVRDYSVSFGSVFLYILKLLSFFLLLCLALGRDSYIIRISSSLHFWFPLLCESLFLPFFFFLYKLLFTFNTYVILLSLAWCDDIIYKKKIHSQLDILNFCINNEKHFIFLQRSKLCIHKKITRNKPQCLTNLFYNWLSGALWKYRKLNIFKREKKKNLILNFGKWQSTSSTSDIWIALKNYDSVYVGTDSRTSRSFSLDVMMLVFLIISCPLV